jgi:hypothetical protein
MVSDPLMVPQILARVGPGAIADWMLHLLGLAAYTFLDWDAKVGPAWPPPQQLWQQPLPGAGQGGRGAQHKVPGAVCSARSHNSA